MIADKTNADRYQHIAALAEARDRQERDLVHTEAELRRLIYQLEDDE